MGLSTVDSNMPQHPQLSCDIWSLPFTLTSDLCPLQKYKKPKFIPCFVFLPDGNILTGDSEGNILTWGRSVSDSKTPGRGGAKGMWLGTALKMFVSQKFCGREQSRKFPLFSLCRLMNSLGGAQSRRVGSQTVKEKRLGIWVCQISGAKFRFANITVS